MNIIYNKKYFENYDIGEEKVVYDSSDIMKNHMLQVAKNIKDTINPRTVLDAGCATGTLVANLRDLGIEAYGIDVSEYAISSVREDIKPYCFVGSLDEVWPEEIPKKVDLIVNTEVLEHMREAQGLKAIEIFTKYSDNILFSSTPDAIEDPTHINVQLQEYWAEKYSKLGFYNKVDFDATFIASHAMLFVKSEEISVVISDYERILRLDGYEKKSLEIALSEAKEETLNCNNLLEDKNLIIEDKNLIIEDKNLIIEDKNLIIEDKNLIIKELNQETSDTKIKSNKTVDKIINELNAEKRENISLREEMNHLSIIIQGFQTSFFWKITKPFRWFLDIMKKFFKNNKLTKNLYKFLLNLKYLGFASTISKTKNYFSKRKGSELLPTKEELFNQKNEKFSKNVLFSIVVPVYNPSIAFLKDMINSVLNQTYENWELCLADGGNSAEVKKYCEKMQNKNSKILYTFLGENKGISGNTNAGIDMVIGDYIVLLDHDDILHPSALYDNMKVIEDIGADFIYSDEATFVNKITNIVSRHYKPDFSPDTLRSYNYITHLSVFKKELLHEVGNFNSECDGSQDYDIILRLTEKAKTIYHIPKILYFWRSHKNSVAYDASAKPYAVNSAIKAIKAHLKREKLDFSDVKEGLVNTTYKIEYLIKDNPLVSIIIPNKDSIDILKTCIDSILFKTTYNNYEIFIVENNSENEETFEYYDYIKNIPNIDIIHYEGDFNYPLINNYGVEKANGDYFVLLNNDMEILTPNWIEEMLIFAQRSDVGAVGAKLYYPDDTIQHAGVILGIGGVAGHSHKYLHRSLYGYMSRASIVQNLSAVTAACLMISKNKFNEIYGLDKNFTIAFNDVDFCLRLREKGYLNIFTPFAEMYHYESKTRGYENTPEKIKRFNNEMYYFKKKWINELRTGDPYYNKNLTLDTEDFSFKANRL